MCMHACVYNSSGRCVYACVSVIMYYRMHHLIDQLTESYPIDEVPQLVVRDNFGCSLYPSLGDGALSFSPALGGVITLPASLSATLPSQPSLVFCAYKNEALFIRRENSLGQGSITLASGVVSARFSGELEVSGLEDPIVISFSKTKVIMLHMCEIQCHALS